MIEFFIIFLTIIMSNNLKVPPILEPLPKYYFQKHQFSNGVPGSRYPDTTLAKLCDGSLCTQNLPK